MDSKRPLDYATPPKAERQGVCGLGIVGLMAAITSLPFAIEAYRLFELAGARSFYLDRPAAQFGALLTGALILTAVVLGVLSICKAKGRGRTGWVTLAISTIALVILVRAEMLVR